MKKKIVSAAVLLTMWTTGLLAQEGAIALPAVPADTAVRVGVLDNGMTYYIRHNAKPEKQAQFFIVHNVGAMQEEDSQQGLAHFLEHMAFNGTENLPGKMLLEYLESVGVKFGVNLNAGTGREVTSYRISDVPLTREGIVDTALLILHDWAGYISLLPEEIDKERGVIVEELRTRNTAEWRVSEKSAPAIFNRSKYADRNVIGSIEGLRSFPYDEIRNFYYQWYRPDLQAVIVVGDFDPAWMETKVKDVMSRIPAAENPTPKEVVEIPENEAPVIDVITDPELTTTDVTVYIRREPVPREYNNTILTAMNDVLDSYLYRIANERLTDISQQPDAPFISAWMGGGSLTNTSDVTLGTATARNGEGLKALEALYSELEKIRRYGFTPSEFERARAELMRASRKSYDNRTDTRNIEYASRYIDAFLRNSAIPSAETRWELDSTLIASLDLQSLNMFTQSRITPENQTVILTAPDKEGTSVPSGEEITVAIERIMNSELEAYEDVSINEPLIPEGTKLKGSRIRKTAADKFGATVWTLGNGATVVFMPTDYKADEVLLRANAFGGTSLLPDDEVDDGGLLPILTQLSGVGAFSMTDLQKQLSGKAVSLYPMVSEYSAGFVGTASPKDIETQLQLLYLYFTNPRFTEEDFATMVNRYKAVFENRSSDPAYVRQDTMVRALFGNNPRRQIISASTFDSLSLETMKAAYGKFFGNAADFTFTIVGNISEKELKPMVEKYIGSLPASKKKLSWRDDGVRLAEGRIDKRFATPMQMPKTTVIYVYSGELPYSIDNMLTLNALGQVLTIRYTESIREEKGGSYGIDVVPETKYIPEEFYDMLIAFDTDPDKADELTELVTEELELIAREGPAAADLAKVKEYMLKQYPEDLKKNNVWANYLDTYHRAGHDLRTGYEETVESLTPDSIRDMARKILSDGNLITIIQEPATQE